MNCSFVSQEGLLEIISKLDDIKEEEREELADILDRYFDPEKEIVMPVSKKPSRQRRRSYRGGRKSGDKRSGTDGEHSGDRPSSSPENRQRKRRSRRRVSTKSQPLKPELHTRSEAQTELPAIIALPMAPPNPILLGTA